MQMTFQIAPNEAKWRSEKSQQKAEQGAEEVEKLKHYEYYYVLQGKGKQTRGTGIEGGSIRSIFSAVFSVDNVNDFGCFRPKQAEQFKQALADDTLFA